MTSPRRTGTHPGPEALPIPCGDAVRGLPADPLEIEQLLAAGRKYRSFKHWGSIRVGRSEAGLTGQGFNAVKFDPRRPARTIRKNDGQLGMHGAMHWSEPRRFTLGEFKRIASFPDGFRFAGAYEHAVGQIGNCVPPLFMRSIAMRVRQGIFEAAT